MIKIFKEKSVEEIRDKGIKKLSRLYKIDDLSEVEKETFYYISLNFNSRKELDKQLVESMKHLAKMIAQENITEQEVLIAQNFTIIDYLATINKNLEELKKLK